MFRRPGLGAPDSHPRGPGAPRRRRAGGAGGVGVVGLAARGRAAVEEERQGAGERKKKRGLAAEVAGERCQDVFPKK